MIHESESERQKRVVDMMVSMHSDLRDKYRRRALLLNSSLLAVAVILCACVFIDKDVLALLGLAPDVARVCLGVASVLAFLFSILELKVDWQGKARSHAEAADKLSRLKVLYRQADTDDNKAMADSSECTSEYDNVMSQIPAVPERYFNTLKARHYFKRELSKRIGEHPKAPLWVLKFVLRWEGIKSAFSSRRNDEKQ